MLGLVADFMETAEAEEVDFIKEIRLRTWARQNYQSPGDRGNNLHPVVLDEMQKMDSESE
ncbi:hypothetical protein Pla110_12630 [Polystyrenella longa]|uniref:Uncharacterized protein n=1 Tax=Polystyrenella longa TaxID=2528007 RepID=A0A518CK00_9PLAN|nr:hypothetical protein [Polystyrenella longa]QDU79552.1 hypothetical protein Pla110_12630 [Polystyrenella longa]